MSTKFTSEEYDRLDIVFDTPEGRDFVDDWEVAKAMFVSDWLLKSILHVHRKQEESPDE